MSPCLRGVDSEWDGLEKEGVLALIGGHWHPAAGGLRIRSEDVRGMDFVTRVLAFCITCCLQTFRVNTL